MAAFADESVNPLGERKIGKIDPSRDANKLDTNYRTIAGIVDGPQVVERSRSVDLGIGQVHVERICFLIEVNGSVHRHSLSL